MYINHSDINKMKIEKNPNECRITGKLTRRFGEDVTLSYQRH